MILKKQSKSLRRNGSMIDKDLLFNYLDELYPDAHCELNYSNNYELLIAIMLSAQTTDKAVNKATAILFKHYPTLGDLKNASLEDIEKDISFLGMYHNKAKHVKDIATALVNQYDGEVPHDAKALTALPGVGNKTKNCFLAEAYHEPYLAVDTHVQRISKRLGLAKDKDDVLTIEKKLLKYIPTQRLIKTNHQIIWFGRYKCKAIKPDCKNCKLADFCKEKVKN